MGLVLSLLSLLERTRVPHSLAGWEAGFQVPENNWLWTLSVGETVTTPARVNDLTIQGKSGMSHLWYLRVKEIREKVPSKWGQFKQERAWRNRWVFYF